jgi:hypothetical protein
VSVLRPEDACALSSPRWREKEIVSRVEFGAFFADCWAMISDHCKSAKLRPTPLTSATLRAIAFAFYERWNVAFFCSF